MFTGIITALGRVERLDIKPEGGVRAHISTPWDCEAIAIGSSIACNGVCLTVVEVAGNGYDVDISPETLAVTGQHRWHEGMIVNLERALSVGDEWGGHIVSGHVDGLAEIIAITAAGDSHQVTFAAPCGLAAMIAAKGSVALDGVSLTVNKVDGNQFDVMIIPHTWDKTRFHSYKVGEQINLEVDMLARYVARALSVLGDKNDG